MTSLTSDLELSTRAMDGEWVVERYELEDDGNLRVHYRSKDYPLVGWSHIPFDFEAVAPVGTVGRIGFISNERLGK